MEGAKVVGCDCDSYIWIRFSQWVQVCRESRNPLGSYWFRWIVFDILIPMGRYKLLGVKLEMSKSPVGTHLGVFIYKNQEGDGDEGKVNPRFNFGGEGR